MAEVAAAASILGITTFGIQLTDTLYKFGSNFSAAREQSNRISDRITDYTTILDILAATLEADQNIFSHKAVELIQKLCDQSYDLFYDIEDLLPPRKEGHGRSYLTLTQKIAWNFRKSKVELLLGEIEYVKSNVLLLLMTSLVGKKIHSYRKQKKKSSQKQHDEEAEVVQQQSLRAKNAIVQHMNATENLSKLQEEADKVDEAASTEGQPADSKTRAEASRALTLVSRQNVVVASFQQAMIKVEDLGQRQAWVIEQSPLLLHDLLMQWTTVELDRKEAQSPDVPVPEDVGTAPKARETPSPAPKENDSAKRTNRDYGKDMPTFARSSTMPIPTPLSRRDATALKTSALKHTDSHDVGTAPKARETPSPTQNESDSAKRTNRNYGKDMPTLARSSTMPIPTPLSRRDATALKPSALKHTDSHDVGYGSSSSPHPVEMRGESPQRRPVPASRKPSTRYQIVDPSDSEDDLRTRIRVAKDKPGRRRYQQNPEQDGGEFELRRKEVEQHPFREIQSRRPHNLAHAARPLFPSHLPPSAS
jgi:hypothetical protein